ncbi:MAG: MaoC/PaaZ C-terminal domain-containing protein [Solirubrobacteraceae bacterium]
MYFEDFEVGASFVTAGRTITESDVMGFAGLSGDMNPLHVDREFARRSEFGEPVAHGLLVLSIAAGLGIQTGIFSGTNLALLGLEEWRFLGAVRFGDTIHMTSTVIETRRTSKGGRGVVRLAQEISNQRDEVVQTGVFASLMAMRTDRSDTGVSA